MPFADDMERLREITARFENEILGIDDAMVLFEESVGLVRSCREHITDARRHVTELTQDGESESDIEP